MKADPSVSPRPRGRPRAFDAEQAMQQVMATFWRLGYAGTSVDDLSAATGLSKPSLYGAWGDKQTLYRQALSAYVAQVGAGLQAAMEGDQSLSDAFGAVLQQALALYAQGRGCFLVVTAPTAACEDEAVRTLMAQALAHQDTLFAARFERAQAQGEWGGEVSPQVAAGWVSACLHSLALRARAGVPEQELAAWGQQSLRALLSVGMKPLKPL